MGSRYAAPRAALDHRALAVVAAALVLLAACTGTPSFTAPEPKEIDVATPEMVAIKAAAGIEDCPAGQTGSGALPKMSLRCLGGGTTTDLSTLKGPLVINFWQSACAPCREEMPALQEFHERFGDQVPIIGIDTTDTYPGVALEQAQQRGVTYPLLADLDGELASEMGVDFLPTFFFLSADGELTSKRGGLETADEVVAMVEKQLGVDLS